MAIFGFGYFNPYAFFDIQMRLCAAEGTERWQAVNCYKWFVVLS